MSHLIAALALACLTSAQEDTSHTSGRPVPPEQACFDVRRYELDVEVLPETQAIRASLRMDARLLSPTHSLILDLDGALSVDSVVLLEPHIVDDPLPLHFSHEGGELRIGAGEELSALPAGGEFALRVDYHGVPRVAPRAPWDGGFQWERTPSGAHWIATSNQMQGADLWWPCKDQPDDEPEGFTLRITVPEGLVCASNGTLRGVTTSAGRSTFEWEVTTPINAYGIALNIAPYETITAQYESTAGETFPVTYWVLPENREQGEVLFQDLLRQLRWFEETFGPYPFRADKCGLVETPHLGMEHQSITAYGNGYRGNPWGADQGFDFLMHHELAHEWWANLVTCRNWNDFWIHESFGTYAQSLYTEALNGPEAYRQRMGELRGGILNRGPVAPREPLSSAEVYFGATGGDIYNKGAWVLHTLRWLVGDEDFFRAVRRMAYPDPALERTTDGSACRFSDTAEILAIAERETGRELDWFFEVYLRQPALPRLVSELEGDELRLAWLLPGGLEFPMPVQLEIDGERRRIELPGGEAVVDVSGAVIIELDPDSWLLMSEE
jgi:aminopeptidase N